MSELYLVRHGQASFGTDDYDKLSATGHQQATILCNYWHSIEQRFDAIYSGGLQRQLSTAEALAERANGKSPIVLEGFDEYVSHHILDAYREQYAQTDGFVIEGEGYASGMKDRRFFSASWNSPVGVGFKVSWNRTAWSPFPCSSSGFAMRSRK